MNATLHALEYHRQLTEEQRESLRAWAEREGVPIKPEDWTYALEFGEGHVKVYQYPNPVEIRAGIVTEGEPFIVSVKTPPPLDVLRFVLVSGDQVEHEAPEGGTG